MASLSSIKPGIVNAGKLATLVSCDTAGPRTGHIFKMMDEFSLIWERNTYPPLPAHLPLPFPQAWKNATKLVNIYVLLGSQDLILEKCSQFFFFFATQRNLLV